MMKWHASVSSYSFTDRIDHFQWFHIRLHLQQRVVRTLLRLQWPKDLVKSFSVGLRDAPGRENEAINLT